MSPSRRRGTEKRWPGEICTSSMTMRPHALYYTDFMEWLLASISERFQFDKRLCLVSEIQQGAWLT